MSIERFNLEIYRCNGGEMLTDSQGEYVSYEDYKILEAAYHSKEEEEEIKELKARISNLGWEAEFARNNPINTSEWK